MKLLLSVTFFFLSHAKATQAAFMFNNGPKPVDQLVDFAEALQKAKRQLDIGLEITKKNLKESEQRTPSFSFRGLQVALGQDEPEETKKVLMPGFNGPNPKLSSGVRDLRIKQPGYFVDIFGQQNVNLNGGCWELVWKEGDMAGTLICGFENEKEAKRNEAVLPKGRLYVTFPVWTQEGLATAKAKFDEVKKRAETFRTERDDEMLKVQEASNPFSKLMHYRNAFEKAEQYFMTNWNKIKELVPSNDELMEVGGLLLRKNGAVYAKDSVGVLKTKLGTAQIVAESVEEDDQEE